jgi:hypothetical protein
MEVIAMSENEILILGRTIERILIVLICGASLGLGWNLFREGIVKDQQAVFSKGEWKVALKQVGPGVFFALFAVVGLVFAITSPATVGPSPGSKVAAGNTPIGGWNWAVDSSASKATRDELKAINTLTLLWRTDRSPKTPTAEVQAGDQAARMLIERKEKLLGAIFPQFYDRYKEIKSNQEILQGLSPQQRAQYDEIDHVSDDNLLNPSTH